MDFEVDDIVVINRYPIPKVVGRLAAVVFVRPRYLEDETAYLLIDATGKERAVRHAWLRRMEWDELRSLLQWLGPDTASQT